MAEEEALTESVPLAMEDNFTHWSRYVEVEYADRVVAVKQDPDSFVLGTTVWDSSKTLLKYIEQHAAVFSQYASICELGSGCGALAGIAAAINARGMSDIVLTDIAPVVPWLKENVRTNLSDAERERLRVHVHNWGTPVAELGGPFDCILCADVVYEKDAVKPLFQSILALSHRKTVIYFANERRAPHVRDAFLHHMKTYFTWKEIERSELDTGYIKDAIEVFELRPKKRKIPPEMQIVESKEENVVHPLLRKKEEEDEEDDGAEEEDACRELGTADPYDRDLWDDLLK